MTTRAGAPIVVGADGSPRSLAAVGVAAGEAALHHRRLRIVHALAPAAGADAAERARGHLAEAAKMAAQVAPGLRVTSDAVPGAATPVLLSESARAFLLVLGDRGRSGVADLVPGSVAVQAAMHAACPVLVVRGHPRPDGPVVVGVDGSPNSTLALEFGAEEAALRGVELVALHAWSGTDGTELNAGLPMTYEFWSGDEEERRVLAEALAGISGRHPDLYVRSQVRRGSARRLLGDWSRMAQLVVVGDRGHGGVTGLLLGSVSQHLVYHAGCPTAVVRPALADLTPPATRAAV